MRLAVIAVLAVAAAFAAGIQSAGAIHNARFCVRGNSGLDCAFHTRAQCMATAHGHSHTCVENPRWRGRR
jgi:Protein of unknown function (DUF3551)